MDTGARAILRLGNDGQPVLSFGDRGDGITEIPNLDICNGAPLFDSRTDGSVIVGDAHTIVAVDAAGDIDPTFGADGRLVVTQLAWASGEEGERTVTVSILEDSIDEKPETLGVEFSDPVGGIVLIAESATIQILDNDPTPPPPPTTPPPPPPPLKGGSGSVSWTTPIALLALLRLRRRRDRCGSTRGSSCCA